MRGGHTEGSGQKAQLHSLPQDEPLWLPAASVDGVGTGAHPHSCPFPWFSCDLHLKTSLPFLIMMSFILILDDLETTEMRRKRPPSAHRQSLLSSVALPVLSAAKRILYVVLHPGFLTPHGQQVPSSHDRSGAPSPRAQPPSPGVEATLLGAPSDVHAGRGRALLSVHRC